MQSKEIRAKFLEFFRSKGHEIVPSDSLVPRQDPTLLFTSAGMNQFKEQFLGHNITYRRAASSQKCLRTGDLEKVGKTSGHHTFFEMLGNFSFGDYFKKEAIAWAWEFMTVTMKLPEEKLWVSVYEEDKEAYKIWRDGIKFPEKKIAKFGAKENFWPSNAPEEGPNGPCGPCSEIFYDWGKDTGCRKAACSPACDCGRFIEVWNLVFTQFDRKDGGRLDDLPSRNIDTGMGLERIAAVMQGVKTNFETDLFVPIIEEIRNILESRNGSKEGTLKRATLNTIADHIRAVTFSIADGIAPSNEERGYVVRKLIRKAYLAARAKEPFLYNVVPKISRLMGDVYPEVTAKREEIALVVKDEEEKFRNTLDTALPILDDIMKASKGKTVSGEDLFKLVDTYGLPLEVIEEKASSKKLKLDLEGFSGLMERQKELSRKASKMSAGVFEDRVINKAPRPPVSDKEPPVRVKIAFIAGEKKELSAASEGGAAEIVTDPMIASFYAEAGGQVGDTGAIKGKDFEFSIKNTYNISGRIVYYGEVAKGSLKKGDEATLSLDSARKARIARNHTATHLLQNALRQVLGGHVQQAGSLVAEDRLRFDFTHMKKLTPRELERVEEIVNESIAAGEDVKKEVKHFEEAKAEGAIALFGEKYADKVRVVTAGDSRELCGGTHVDNTGDIGVFKIISESSIASGIRRIEAITSDAVISWLKEDIKDALAMAEKELEEIKDMRKKAGRKASSTEKEADEAISEIRKIKPDREYVMVWSRIEKPKLLAAVEELKKEKSVVGKELSKKTSGEFRQKVDAILSGAKVVSGAAIIAMECGEDVLEGLDLKEALDMIKEKATEKKQPLAAILGSRRGGKVALAGAATEDLVKRGIHIGNILKEVAKMAGGSGGGRPDFAQAGGKDASKLGEALKRALELIEEKL